MDKLSIHHFREPEKGLWISRKIGGEEAFLCCIGPGVSKFGPVIAFRQFGKLFKGWGSSIGTSVKDDFIEFETDEYDDNVFYAGLAKDRTIHLGIIENNILNDYIIVNKPNKEYEFQTFYSPT